MSTNSRLTRYNLVVTKDKAANDNAQVPAGVTVDFYRRIATVATAVTVQNGAVDVNITVNDTGRISAGDVLGKLGTTSPSVTVEAVVDRSTLLVYSNGDGSLVLAVGDWLAHTIDHPTIYKESDGVSTYSSNQVSTDSSTGRLLPAYLNDRLFDVNMTIGGVARLLFDQAGGGHYPIYNVREMGGDVQKVIDSLPATGGVVYLPAGDPYDLTAGLVVDKENVTLVGDGFNSIIRPAYAQIGAFDLITVNRAYFRVYNLQLDCRSTAQNLTSGHCGIVINGLGLTGHLVLECYFENVQITGASRYGLWLRDVIVFLAVNCEFGGNQGHAVRLQKDGTSSTTLRFIGCGFAQNGGKGVEAVDCYSLTFHGCWFEGNKSGWESTAGNCIDALRCGRLEVLSGYFEDAATGVSGSPDHRTEQFIRLDTCPSAVVDGCWFQGGGTNTVPHLKPYRAVRFENSGWSRLSNNSGQNMVTEFALFSSNSQKCIEMGNSDLTSSGSGGVPTLNGAVFNLSGGAVGLFAYADENARNNNAVPRAGSLIWVGSPPSGKSNLQIYDGTGWKYIAFAS